MCLMQLGSPQTGRMGRAKVLEVLPGSHIRRSGTYLNGQWLSHSGSGGAQVRPWVARLELSGRILDE